jgi:hypothetical protein
MVKTSTAEDLTQPGNLEHRDVDTRLRAAQSGGDETPRAFPRPALPPILDGLTPLMWATIHGHLPIVKVLLERDADPFLATPNHFTCLHFASLLGRPDIARSILRFNPARWRMALKKIPPNSEHPLNLAAGHVRTKAVDWIFDTFANAGIEIAEARNVQGETPLHRAAAMNNTAAIWYLSWRTEAISAEAKDSQGRTPFWHAAAAGALGAVDLLVSAGAKINARDDLGRSVLHAACRHGRGPVVMRLLKHSQALVEMRRRTIYEQINIEASQPDILSTSRYTVITAVIYAVLSRDLETLEAVLAKQHLMLPSFGDKLGQKYYFENVQSNFGALHIATANGWLNGVKALCEKAIGAEQIFLRVRYNLVVNNEPAEGRVADSRELADRITVEEYRQGLDPIEIAILHKHMQVLHYLEERQETILDYRTLMGILEIKQNLDEGMPRKVQFPKSAHKRRSGRQMFESRQARRLAAGKHKGP